MADDDLSLASDFPKSSYQDWAALVEKALKGASLEQALMSETYEGLAIKPLYTRSDQRPAPTPRPGRARSGTWDIRQMITNPDPAEANADILQDLAGGAGSVFVSISPDGGAGVAIGDADDLKRLLDGIVLDAAPVALDGGADFARMAEQFLALPSLNQAKRQDVRVSLGADPLGSLAKTGTLAQGLEEALTDMGKLAGRLLDDLPSARAIRLDSTAYHSAGADEAMDLACMLATAAAYLRALESADVAPDAAARTIELRLPVDADIFLAIAKLRAARGLWTRLFEACGVTQAQAFIHATTAPRVMSRYDPWVNLLRVTTTTFAAAIGGAEAITALPHDWALGVPTPFARRIARNIQIVLAEESNLGRVTDPAGGGWYVESLTFDLSQRAWKQFQQIEAQGGMAAVLKSGYIQSQIKETWIKRRDNLAKRIDPLTGVSAFPNVGESLPETPRFPLPSSKGPKISAAATTIEALTAHRLGEDFEALRETAAAYRERTGAGPKVFLAGLGAPSRHTSQTGFAKNYFESGGIEAIISPGPATIEDYARSFSASTAACAVICGDEEHATEQGAALAQALKEAGAVLIFIVNALPEALEDAPIDGVIAAGDDVPARLSEVMNKIGVTQP